METDWFEPEHDKKKHYILNLMDYKTPKDEIHHQAEECTVVGVLTDECEIEFKEASAINEDMILVSEDVVDNWAIEPSIEPDGMQETSKDCAVDVDLSDALELSEVAVGKNLASRGLLFCEVYVDRGNISQYMVANYSDVSVAKFSLPGWDFKQPHVRKQFLKPMENDKPHFIWMAPHALYGHQCRT